MSDGQGDLTRDNNWNEVTVSMTPNPYLPSVNQYINKNFDKLDAIVRNVPKNSKAAIQELTQLFNQANTNDDLRNMLVYGDGETPGDRRYTHKLELIDRMINLHAAKAPKKHPQFKEFTEAWNGLRNSIPEKINYMEGKYRHAINTHQSDIHNAGTNRAKQAAQDRLNKTNNNYQHFNKNTEKSELNRMWEKTSKPSTLGETMQNVFSRLINPRKTKQIQPVQQWQDRHEI
ncbi:MAG: hypothetical protein KTR28_06360 [Micavibrio sp.]|nr:hypothetical protein [Micavibrio sp.]